MNCGCINTVCLDIQAPCGDTVELNITANATGTWSAVVSFNGSTWTAPVQVTNGQKIIVPNKFNEQYTHILKLYKADGTLFNNTCYLIKTTPSITVNS